MEKILYQLHKCYQLIPKQYNTTIGLFLVGKSFSIPFSRTIDLEFESLDSILFYIKDFFNGNKNSLENIKSFNKELYIYAFNKNLKNDNNISYKEIKEIKNDYSACILEVEKLIGLLKI